MRKDIRMDWKQCCAWAVGPGREQEHSLPDPHLCQCPSAVHCLRLATQGPPANSDKVTASEVGGSARSRPPPTHHLLLGSSFLSLDHTLGFSCVFPALFVPVTHLQLPTRA